jgi:hypothetical protein
LAEKCPFSDGTVIYKARALYNQMFEKQEAFKDLCDDKGGAKSMQIQNSVEEKQNGITIYPNPAKDELFLRMSTNETSNVNINVFDASGKIVYENQNLEVNDGLTNFTLNVKNGIYFVYIVDLTNNELKVEKLIINK